MTRGGGAGSCRPEPGRRPASNPDRTPQGFAPIGPARSGSGPCASNRSFRLTLLRPADLEEDHPKGLPDNDQVEPQRTLFDVLDVLLDPLLEIGPAAAGALDLPESGNARPHAQPRLAPGGAELV